MSKENIFDLIALINTTDGNPDSIVDAVWGAGYRKPERSANEAALLTIDVFFEFNAFSIPARYWPETWGSILKNELTKIAMGEDFDLDSKQVAKRISEAGYVKVMTNDAA